MEPWTSGIQKTARNSDYVIALVTGLIGLVILPVIMEYAIGAILDLTQGAGTFKAALSELGGVTAGTITSPAEVSKNAVALVALSQVLGEALALVPIIWLYHAMFQDDARRFKASWKRNVLLIIGGTVAVLAVSLLLSTLYSAAGIKTDAANEVLVEASLLRFPVIETVAVLVIAPFVEEFVFRKCLFGIIIEKFHWPHAIALVISSVAFAIVHAHDVYFFFYLALALIMGLTYDRSQRNLLVSTSVHVMNNLLSYLGLFLS